MILASARSASASATPMSPATLSSASGSSASTSSPMNTLHRPALASDTRIDAVLLRETWQADEAIAQASVTATSTVRGDVGQGRGPGWVYCACPGCQVAANTMLVSMPLATEPANG